MPLVRRFPVFATVLALAACQALQPATLPYADLEPPGFFDIGAGYGRVTDTRGTSNDDAEGLMLSFKAYPLGRWYGEPRSDLAKGLSAEARNTVDILYLHHARKAFGRELGALSDEVRTKGQALLRDPEVHLRHDDRVLLAKAVEEQQPLSVTERTRLKELATTEPPAAGWHVVRERSAIWHRLSVFYGRSIQDFDSGGLQSDVNAVGIGFDVSPDLALQVGYAFYEVDDGTGIDSDHSWFFGIALNLYSFKRLGTALADL